MRVFSPDPIPSQDLYTGYYFKYAPERTVGGLFKDNLPPNYFETLEYVASAEQAEAIIVPNNFTSVGDLERAYIAAQAELGAKLGVPVFVFSCGDYTDKLTFDSRVFVFRYSMYKSEAGPHDICAPTLTEDIGRGGTDTRNKTDKPTVSFCGKAGFATPREISISWLRRIKFEARSLVGPSERAHIRGVFWRMQAIKACSNSSLLKTLFILRKTFSGARQTIEVPPEQAREEFINSVRKSDFVLTPKGDGNYSNRFLEALSMGRIPVVIDTDIVLPFEDKIDYSKIMVRVPMDQVARTPWYINDFYEDLRNEEWILRQRTARETFETYLRQDKFFANYFSLRQTQK
jgi:hypothetical protein